MNCSDDCRDGVGSGLDKSQQEELVLGGTVRNQSGGRQTWRENQQQEAVRHEGCFDKKYDYL